MRDMDSLLAEAQTLLCLLVALQCAQELIQRLGNIYFAAAMERMALAKLSRRRLLVRLLARLLRALPPNTHSALESAPTAWLLCAYSALAVCLLCACHALTKMCNLR